MKWIILPLIIGFGQRTLDQDKIYKYQLQKEEKAFKVSEINYIGSTDVVNEKETFGFVKDFEYDVSHHARDGRNLKYCYFRYDRSSYHYVGTCKDLVKKINEASKCSN